MPEGWEWRALRCVRRARGCRPGRPGLCEGGVVVARVLGSGRGGQAQRGVGPLTVVPGAAGLASPFVLGGFQSLA